jgi:hypothetical protein
MVSNQGRGPSNGNPRLVLDECLIRDTDRYTRGGVWLSTVGKASRRQLRVRPLGLEMDKFLNSQSLVFKRKNR